MDNIHKNIEDYNQNKKRKILIAFDDMIADKLNHKTPNPIVTESFIRGRKLNISLVLLQNRLNSTHYFIMKIPKKNFSKLCLIIH